MTANYENGREVTFEITEHIGVIAAYSTGWKKELNIVSWNGGAPKYDIRDWDPEHEHMSRGITLHEKEMRLVMDMARRNGQQKAYAGRKTDANSCVSAMNTANAEMDSAAYAEPQEECGEGTEETGNISECGM